MPPWRRSGRAPSFPSSSATRRRTLPLGKSIERLGGFVRRQRDDRKAARRGRLEAHPATPPGRTARGGPRPSRCGSPFDTRDRQVAPSSSTPSTPNAAALRKMPPTLSGLAIDSSIRTSRALVEQSAVAACRRPLDERDTAAVEVEAGDLAERLDRTDIDGHARIEAREHTRRVAAEPPGSKAPNGCSIGRRRSDAGRRGGPQRRRTRRRARFRVRDARILGNSGFPAAGSVMIATRSLGYHYRL